MSEVIDYDSHKSPLVSVVALCYNHEAYVVETLESILNQNYNNLEIVIIDNKSSDNSVSVIKKWIEKNEHNNNIKFIPNEINLGVCGALNQALKIIKGEFYQFISCDDILLFDKISIQVKILNESPDNVAFAYGDLLYIDYRGTVKKDESFFQKRGFRNQFDLPSGRIKSLLIENYFLAAPTILYRTKSVLEIGGYDEKIPFEDFQMNLRLLEKFACIGIYRVTCHYRVLENSLYNSSSERKISHNYFLTSKYFYQDSITQKWIVILKYILYSNDILSKIFSFFIFRFFKISDQKIMKNYINKNT